MLNYGFQVKLDILRIHFFFKFWAIVTANDFHSDWWKSTLQLSSMTHNLLSFKERCARQCEVTMKGIKPPKHVWMWVPLFQMVLSEEVQSLVGVLLQAAEVITNMMNTFLPAITQLQRYLNSIDDLNLVANKEFNEVCNPYRCTALSTQCVLVCGCLCDRDKCFSACQIFFRALSFNRFKRHESTTCNLFFPQMTRGQRTSISSTATFVTLSRALCSNGILALFGISNLPITSESSASSPDNPQREEMIERFKIPQNACKYIMLSVQSPFLRYFVLIFSS